MRLVDFIFNVRMKFYEQVDTFQSRLLTHFHIIHIEWIDMRTISFDFKFNKNWVGS